MSSLSSGRIRISKGALIRAQLKRSLKIVSFAVLLLLILYAVFAATLIRVVPSTSGTGMQLVKNITTPGGYISEGSVVLAHATEKQNNDWQSNIKAAAIPSDAWAEFEVYAGPYGEIQITKDSTVNIDDNTIEDISLSKEYLKDKEYLEDEYLVKCISGNCEEGKGAIVHKDYILGAISLENTEHSNYKGIITPERDSNTVALYSEPNPNKKLDKRARRGDELEVISAPKNGFLAVELSKDPESIVYVYEHVVEEA